MSSPIVAAAASWGACTSCTLLINPVASPLFLPTVRVVVIFLGGALLALVLLGILTVILGLVAVVPLELLLFTAPPISPAGA
jgi:hypothetical protein